MEEDNSLLFQSFELLKDKNPSLKEDLVFAIDNNTLKGALQTANFSLIPSFTTNAASVGINGVEQISGQNAVDFRIGVTYTLISATGTQRQYFVKIIWDSELPRIIINTTGGVPIISKTDYISTQIIIDGKGQYPDFTGTAQIRGRGNSTWTFPKKPYKFKLAEDAAILGLTPEKDWILLSNFLDGTHLLNAVGMKIGKLLEMPFTNHTIPVEVTLNGDYLGAYMLTEQIEVKKNRVDVGKDGLLLNLDTNFDEPRQFQSKSYQLPVTIKYPKELTSNEFAAIKNDFQKLEALVADADFPNNNYLDYIEETSIVNYLITYILTGNEEINHPKSTYLYKEKEGKYFLGPIWDFDWAFSFEGSFEHFSSFDRPLFWSPPSRGTRFFSRFLEDPKIKALLKEKWTDFQANRLPELLTYIDEYAFNIRGARTRDLVKWAQGENNYDVEVAKLKTWLSNRGRYMYGFIDGL